MWINYNVNVAINNPLHCQWTQILFLTSLLIHVCKPQLSETVVPVRCIDPHRAPACAGAHEDQRLLQLDRVYLSSAVKGLKYNVPVNVMYM